MNNSSSAVPPEPEDVVCAVCHERFRIPCQANCSHWFCVQACNCPICRRLINLLVPANITELQQDDPQLQRILGEIQHYNLIFGGAPRTLTQRLQVIPFFIRRLFRELLDPHQTLPISWMMLMVVLSAIYVVSPVDFLPESVLGIVGFLDDLLVLLIVFMHLAAVYQSLLVYRHGGQY